MGWCLGGLCEFAGLCLYVKYLWALMAFGLEWGYVVSPMQVTNCDGCAESAFTFLRKQVLQMLYFCIEYVIPPLAKQNHGFTYASCPVCVTSC